MIHSQVSGGSRHPSPHHRAVLRYAAQAVACYPQRLSPGSTTTLPPRRVAGPPAVASPKPGEANSKKASYWLGNFYAREPGKE
jgi:hypothetical protein